MSPEPLPRELKVRATNDGLIHLPQRQNLSVDSIPLIVALLCSLMETGSDSRQKNLISTVGLCRKLVVERPTLVDLQRDIEIFPSHSHYLSFSAWQLVTSGYHQTLFHDSSGVAK